MSLTKLLKAPIKLFWKEVITFVIIRRYDLGVLEERLRYIAVKPNASISVLRQKVWHLLELPDFCEEIIVLKSNKDVVVPLVDLRKGNDPQHPYILEVFPPANRMQASPAVRNNMLTIGNGDEQSDYANRIKTTDIVYENVHLDNKDDNIAGGNSFSQSTISNETMALNKLHIQDNQMQAQHPMFSGFKKSDLSCRISSTSMFKLGGRKSRDNFANVLLKLQGDLSTLSTKLSVLEKKLPL
ncbi:hypothetical protein PYW08_003274 [Mythimna loreyi]|uniref:Uncharacterized protein n=1 Tax=Mythimna loreyi TaxID=667449 RepID=A0ACC2QTA7_9NEOP|nr:hypothetical protein PYW08_003274 [Mythimna loreyi]